MESNNNHYPSIKANATKKVDAETGELIPSKRLSDPVPVIPAKRGPVPVAEATRSFYGATYLFDCIGNSLDIAEDLKKCFPDTYRQILSVAYYLILEDRNPLSCFSKWAAIHKHPAQSSLCNTKTFRMAKFAFT